MSDGILRAKVLDRLLMIPARRLRHKTDAQACANQEVR